MTDIEQARTQQATARIRELNDQLRISHTGGTLVTTPGVLALGIYLNQAILIAIAAYDDFDEDNDPFGEHDFGLVEIASQEILFKIDYYDNDLRFHSPDPVNADCNFPICAEVKFPSLAGVAINRGRDRRLRLLRVDRAGEASAGSARSGYSLWS